MRVLLVADGRSPTTRRWVKMLAGLGHELILVSTFPCGPVEGVAADLCMPVAFAGLAGSGGGSAKTKSGGARKFISAFRSVFLAGRYRLGPLTLVWYGPKFRKLVEKIQPDVIHALRIPFEGMLASYAPAKYPLAVSIWGNDLTLHAPGSGAMANLTRRTLARANALLADAGRDVRLARGWGLAEAKPTLVVPGSGGLDLQEIARVRAAYRQETIQLPIGDTPLVLNPRGFRTGSVRSDTFFAAIPLVLQRRPGVAFACAAMAGQADALRWVERLKLDGKVHLLPHLPQHDLWNLFLRAAVTVSVSQHDGTPNTLLEAMALGCFPVAGDIESIREWITPGVNGLLVEPTSPQALAEAILLALDSNELRICAAQANSRQVAERAEVGAVQAKVRGLYESLM